MARQNYQPGNPTTLQLNYTKQHSKTETAMLAMSPCMPVGRPKLRHKAVIKRDLKDYGIHPMPWQTVAEERPTWRTSLTVWFAIHVQGKVDCGATLESPGCLTGHCGNPTMTRPSGDDRLVSCSAIFVVVRRTLFALHMCCLFHYTCLTDFSFANILLSFYYIVCDKLCCIKCLID